MTTNELVSSVYSDWGEDETNSVVSPINITRMLNKAQRHLCGQGMILLTCAKTSTVAAQETYNLPTDYWKAEAVFYYGTGGDRHLFPMNVGDRDPEQRQGAPNRYYIWGSNVSSTNQYVIGLNPVPGVNGTDDLEVFYRQLPRKMVHSTEATMVNPEVNEMWQDAMVDYALMSIYRRLGNDFVGLYRDHRAGWNDWMMKAKEYVNPLQFDIPIPRRDTGLYTWDYPVG